MSGVQREVQVGSERGGGRFRIPAGLPTGNHALQSGVSLRLQRLDNATIAAVTVSMSRTSRTTTRRARGWVTGDGGVLLRRCRDTNGDSNSRQNTPVTDTRPVFTRHARHRQHHGPHGTHGNVRHGEVLQGWSEAGFARKHSASLDATCERDEMHCTVRAWLPPPHGREQEPQSDTSQSGDTCAHAPLCARDQGVKRWSARHPTRPAGHSPRNGRRGRGRRHAKAHAAPRACKYGGRERAKRCSNDDTKHRCTRHDGRRWNAAPG